MLQAVIPSEGQTGQRLLTARETAHRLGCKASSLRDRRYRSRLRLPAIRLGGRLMFCPEDIERIIENSREVLMPSGGGASGGIRAETHGIAQQENLRLPPQLSFDF